MKDLQRLCLTLLIISSFPFLVSCASSGVPGWTDTQVSAERNPALELVEKSVAAHGGDVFREVRDLSVSYEGEWGFLASRIQPVVADRRYRKSSEERYLLGEGIIFQKHVGPGGYKTVLRGRDSIEVSYDGTEVTEEPPKAASALVADVYLMLITGPSFFLRDGVDLRATGREQIQGREYDVVLARVRPGFGFSREDRAQLWLDRETGLLHRVQFTLEGFETTRGAEVDVTFLDHREIDGRVWPTRFVERIREPFDIFAHRWRLLGLDVDRGLFEDDLTGTVLSADAAAPASRLEVTR
jgi:hypothetical protein